MQCSFLASFLPQGLEIDALHGKVALQCPRMNREQLGDMRLAAERSSQRQANSRRDTFVGRPKVPGDIVFDATRLEPWLSCLEMSKNRLAMS